MSPEDLTAATRLAAAAAGLLYVAHKTQSWAATTAAAQIAHRYAYDWHCRYPMYDMATGRPLPSTTEAHHAVRAVAVITLAMIGGCRSDITAVRTQVIGLDLRDALDRWRTLHNDLTTPAEEA